MIQGEKTASVLRCCVTYAIPELYATFRDERMIEITRQVCTCKLIYSSLIKETSEVSAHFLCIKLLILKKENKPQIRQTDVVAVRVIRSYKPVI